MQHYFGVKAILQRIGYSPNNYRRFPHLVQKLSIPCYPAIRNHRRCYMASEVMLSNWELSRAKQTVEQIAANERNGLDRRFKALDRLRRTAPREARQTDTPQPVGSEPRHKP